MEEAWVAVFRNLYTGFLLRDFAGKIVPGTLLLFSLWSLFLPPRTILAEIKNEVPVFVVLLVAGLAWTVTLGTQSLAEGLGIWRYFPGENIQGTQQTGLLIGLISPPTDTTFDKDTNEVDEFQSKASEDEKQQYERFMVIKEACGNLFVAALLSTPIWIYIGAQSWLALRSRWDFYRGSWKAALFSAYLLLILIGLHRMHSQHVYRQLQFAKDIGQKHKTAAELPTSSVAASRNKVQRKEIDGKPQVNAHSP
jgi:hypothetical protein